MQNENELAQLRSLIEDSVGKKMTSPSDFQFLSGVIAARCRETLGVTTLKRLWGYIEGYDTIRESTLNLLARCVGFHSWEDYLTQYAAGGESSKMVFGKTLLSEQLPAEALLQISWAPDRQCIFKHCSNGDFVVIESRNSKLKVGDTFHCQYFIVGQPLYLSHLQQQDKKTEMFVVGNKVGISELRVL